jgi:rubrerythrin
MTVFIALLLTAAVFAFIVYPFFKQKSGMEDTYRDTELEELHSRRDTTYSMLKELEFDYQSGILTEEDYRDLEKRYKRKGISLLKDIDQLGEGPGLDDEIEKQIGKLRRPESKAAGPDDKIEKQIGNLRQPASAAHFCPQCGEKHQTNDRFCAHCGTRLDGEKA